MQPVWVEMIQDNYTNITKYQTTGVYLYLTSLNGRCMYVTFSASKSWQKAAAPLADKSADFPAHEISETPVAAINRRVNRTIYQLVGPLLNAGSVPDSVQFGQVQITDIP